jgi:hypothetical protein
MEKPMRFRQLAMLVLVLSAGLSAHGQTTTGCDGRVDTPCWVVGTRGLDTITVSDGAAGTEIRISVGATTFDIANEGFVGINGDGGDDPVTFDISVVPPLLDIVAVRDVGSIAQARPIAWPRVAFQATQSVILDDPANDVDYLEVVVDEGPITYVDHDGVTIGQTSGDLTGVWVRRHGDVRISTNGPLTLADNTSAGGSTTVAAGAFSGNLVLEALGPSGSISGDPAISASGGNVTISAEADLGFTGGASGHYILGWTGIALSASNIDLSGQMEIYPFPAGTALLSARARNDFSISAPAASNPAEGLRFGNGYTTNIQVTAENKITAGANAFISTSGSDGAIELVANRIAIEPTAVVPENLWASGIVIFRPYDPARGFDLGSTTDNGADVEISPDELLATSAPQIRIQASQGHINVTGPMAAGPAIRLVLSTAGEFTSSGGSLSAAPLIFEDAGDTPRTWLIDPSSVTIGKGRPITFTNTRNLHAKGSNRLRPGFPGPLGDDYFQVAPSFTTRFHIDGGDPMPPASPGDTIAIIVPVETMACLREDPPKPPFPSVNEGFSGQYEFTANYLPIFFTRMEGLDRAIVKCER